MGWLRQWDYATCGGLVSQHGAHTQCTCISTARPDYLVKSFVLGVQSVVDVRDRLEKDTCGRTCEVMLLHTQAHWRQDPSNNLKLC